MEEERERLVREKEERERVHQEQLKREAMEKERKEKEARIKLEREREEREAEMQRIREEEFTRKQLEEYEKNKEKNIYDQIKNELAKIKEEDDKMKAKIEKERKKKSLLQQIQNEISRIKGDEKSVKDEIDYEIDDETPPWLKMVMSSKNKEMKKEKKQQVSTENATAQNIVMSLPEDVEAFDTPAWIKIFEERSKKLNLLKTDNQQRQAKKREVKYEVENVPDSPITDDDNDKDIKAPRPTISLNFADYESAIAQNEAIVQKSVKDLKIQLENNKSANEEAGKVKRRTEKSVVDRVRKVKSMLLESGKKEDAQQKDDEVKAKVSKGKAKNIKNIFEKSINSDTENIKPRKPKRKYIRPSIQTEDTVGKFQHKAEEKDWKWKHKSVSELYNYINKNKEHIPSSITKLTEISAQTNNNINEYCSNPNYDEDIEFDSYLSSIHEYIGEKDKNDTESCFKDTIKAYLNLIEDDKEQKNISTQQKVQKNIALTSTSDLKTRLSESFQKNQTLLKRDVSVGKIDASFLSKPDDVKDLKKIEVSKEMTKNIIGKYENINNFEAPNELYSMKRKLIPSTPDVDTDGWKKKQVQHQWKYKQKNIEDLQMFLMKSKKEESLKRDNSNETKKQYTSIFNHIDFAKKVEEDEKKMLEFEKFMDEVHDYLESDTMDEGESAFKWGIHAYMDLIEDSELKNDVSVKYEKKHVAQSNIPKLKDIKDKLESNNDFTTGNAKEVGRLDVTSYIPSTNEKESTNDQNLVNFTNKDVNVLSRKSIFELSEDQNNSQDFERTIVKKKIIDNARNEEVHQPYRLKNQHDWKYKKKSLQQLQQFISRNEDIASKDLLVANNKIVSKQDNIDSASLLANSSKLVSKIKDRDAEFEDFMAELSSYMNEKSDTDEKEAVKDNIRQYLQLIGSSENNRNSTLPSIGSARKVRDIKESLSTKSDKDNSKQVNTNLIGKVSHFFKKNTNEKLNSNVVKENIASLLEPGKAKLVKESLEKKPKIKRSSSVIDLPVSKGQNKLLFENKINNADDSGPSLASLKERQFNTNFKYKNRGNDNLDSIKVMGSTKSAKKEPVKSQWDQYEDPEEKRKAILAKHGLKFTPRQNDDSEMEEILNYESKDDMKEYERELKQRYFLCDAEDSSFESSPEIERKKKEGSHSSLLNILNVMKKAATSKTFSETKSKVKDFGKSSSYSKSDIDLSEIGKSCTDVRTLFENGDAFNRDQKRTSIFDDEELSQFNTAEKKSQWESNFANSSRKSRSDFDDPTIKIQSIEKVKKMFEEGEITQDTLQKFINQRSVVADENEKHLTVQEELEELRQSAKLKSMFRIEKGSADQKSSLRRTNSCIGVSGERLPEDLDDEVMAEVSVTNKMVKAMFEQNAPKYKFGGSGSNLSLNGSKEKVSSQGPVKRPSVKPKEERKWVLDTINKFFDVIVEEEEEMEEDDYEEEEEDEDDYDSDDSDMESEYSEYDEEDEVCNENIVDTNYQSTNKMRGLLSSVVTKISGSVGNLAQKDLIHSLKHNLGSQINLKSNTNISST